MELIQESRFAASYPVKNMIQLMGNHANDAEKLALRHKVNGAWVELTWGQIHDRARAMAEGLVALGVQPGGRVAIFADTCLEWLLMNMALLQAGAACVPIYGSDTPEEVAFIVNDSNTRLIVVDHDKVDHHKQPGRWSRVKAVLDQMPSVEKVVAFSVSESHPKLMSLADMEAHGKQALESGKQPVGETLIDQVKWDDMATLLYTSGTTGKPKGVILTHGNWISQSYNVIKHGVLVSGDNVMLFLPLAHSFGLEIAATWMGQDITVSLAESIDKLLDNAREVHPTVLPAVPRVFEKAFNKVVAQGRASEGIQGSAFDWAMDLFDQYAAARAAKKPFRSIQWILAKKMVFTKLHEKMSDVFGGKIRCFVSGGAPLALRIAYFFDVCELVICEGFGMTETSASTHCNLDGRDGRKVNLIGTCGPAFPDLETKVAEDGEIYLRGPQVMKGYFNLPQETADALTEDGWLKTGDIGIVDENGCLKITDRKKDLIKTSGGKYVAPADLENSLKTNPIVGYVSIQGDCRKFISAVFTLDKEEVLKVAQGAGLTETDHAKLLQEKCVVDAVQKIVTELNAKQPSYATIKKFILLADEWTQESGELTPTLKVKRRVIGQKYKKQLDGLYLD